MSNQSPNVLINGLPPVLHDVDLPATLYITSEFSDILEITVDTAGELVEGVLDAIEASQTKTIEISTQSKHT